MRKRISVAIAVYNGEKYIREQLDSILKQISSEDELVISYNESTDRTYSIIREYLNDPRVKIFNCCEKGIISNFSNAILNSKGEYIVLSDQDDIWTDDKIDSLVQAFEDTQATLLLHNDIIIDENGEEQDESKSLFQKVNATTSVMRNIKRNSYQGSCMAFRHELLPYIFPIPQSLYIHDCWIGLLASLYGKSALLDKKLIYYRRHNQNLSQDERRSLLVILKDRAKLVYHLSKRCLHLKIKGHKFHELTRKE